MSTWEYTYDANGTPRTVTYNDCTYHYVTNIQGDVIAILDDIGRLVCRYAYDAWGNVTDLGGRGDNVSYFNPLRYRGYVYDNETGFYYVSSRYYDPEIGRFINADDIDYLGADGSPLSYNLFAYCMNNPVNRFDVNGNWSLPNWAKKAIAVVAVATTVVAATALTVATCGAGTVAGVAMTSLTATLVAKATEVTVLQVKKGKSEQKSNSQITKDVVESIYDNGKKIIGLTPITKAGTITITHSLNSAVEKGFGGTQTLKATLTTPSKGTVAAVFAAIAWINTINSAFSKDPVTRAHTRGYVLK